MESVNIPVAQRVVPGMSMPQGECLYVSRVIDPIHNGGIRSSVAAPGVPMNRVVAFYVNPTHMSVVHCYLSR